MARSPAQPRVRKRAATQGRPYINRRPRGAVARMIGVRKRAAAQGRPITARL